MARKKWIVIGLSVAILSISFGAIAVADFDGDQVKGWDEMFEVGANPFVHNPALNYAIPRGINDAHLLNMFLQIEADGLDSNEKAFIDFVSGLNDTSWQKVVDYFLADGRISDEEKELVEMLRYLSRPSQQKFADVFFSDEKLDGDEEKVIDFLCYIRSGLIPENVKKYYPVNRVTGLDEVGAIQMNFINSVLENGIINETELQSLGKLANERWYVTKDIINSTMINSKVLNEDLDGDSLSNLDEIMQGTNPLNKLENDPSNLCQRYAVLVASCASKDGDPLLDRTLMKEMCIYLARNGYNDDNVLLIIDPSPNSEWVKNLAIQPDFLVEYDDAGQAVSGAREAEATYFLERTRNLPSDGNDQVFISINSHGNPNALRIGRPILIDEFNTALQFRCGEAILTLDSCFAGNFIEWLNKLYENPNLLLIAGGIDIETTSMVGPEIMKGLDSSKSV